MKRQKTFNGRYREIITVRKSAFDTEIHLVIREEGIDCRASIAVTPRTARNVAAKTKHIGWIVKVRNRGDVRWWASTYTCAQERNRAIVKYGREDYRRLRQSGFAKCVKVYIEDET